MAYAVEVSDVDPLRGADGRGTGDAVSVDELEAAVCGPGVEGAYGVVLFRRFEYAGG